MKASLKRGAVFFLSLILFLSCTLSVSASPTAISEQAPFDVDAVSAVLMDVRMPEMDGLKATAAIRALDRPDAKRVPVIALTANAFDEDVQRSMQAGMNAHLTKPVESDQLIETLGELVYEAQMRA